MVELDKLNGIRKFSRGNSMSCISGNTVSFKKKHTKF